jgi:hypothetical protein
LPTTLGCLLLLLLAPALLPALGCATLSAATFKLIEG